MSENVTSPPMTIGAAIKMVAEILDQHRPDPERVFKGRCSCGRLAVTEEGYRLHLGGEIVAALATGRYERHAQSMAL